VIESHTKEVDMSKSFNQPSTSRLSEANNLLQQDFDTPNTSLRMNKQDSAGKANDEFMEGGYFEDFIDPPDLK